MVIRQAEHTPEQTQRNETLLQLVQRYNVHAPILSYLQDQWRPAFVASNHREPTPADVLSATRDYVSFAVRDSRVASRLGIPHERAESLLRELNNIRMPSPHRPITHEQPSASFQMGVIFQNHGLSSYMQHAISDWAAHRRQTIPNYHGPTPAELIGFSMHHLDQLRQNGGIQGVSTHELSIAIRELDALWRQILPPSSQNINSANTHMEDVRMETLAQAGLNTPRFQQLERAWEQEWTSRYGAPTPLQRLNWTIAQLETARNYNQVELLGTTNELADYAVHRLTGLRDTANYRRR